MKKKVWTRVFALCFALVMALSFVLVGCDNEPETPPATTYTVTVVGGTGGGTFEAGESCTVTASIPGGQTFLGWSDGESIVSTANPYTFTVSANVTLTAQFAAAGQEGVALSLQKSTGGNPIGGFGIGDVRRQLDDG